MRQRRVYISHHIDGIYTAISETRNEEVVERIYTPNPTSTARLEELLCQFSPHHANFTWGHMSATWVIDGDVSICLERDYLPTFTEQPEVERCYSCGHEAEYLYEGMCSTCHNADMAVEEYNQLHYERWLNGEEL